jgi:hypothetical protein
MDHIHMYKTRPVTDSDRPLKPQGAEAPRISRQSSHEGVKVVSLKQRPSLSAGDTW